MTSNINGGWLLSRSPRPSSWNTSTPTTAADAVEKVISETARQKPITDFLIRLRNGQRVPPTPQEYVDLLNAYFDGKLDMEATLGVMPECLWCTVLHVMPALWSLDIISITGSDAAFLLDDSDFFYKGIIGQLVIPYKSPLPEIAKSPRHWTPSIWNPDWLY